MRLQFNNSKLRLLEHSFFRRNAALSIGFGKRFIVSAISTTIFYGFRVFQKVIPDEGLFYEK